MRANGAKPCYVCVHPRRGEIDSLVAEGKSANVTIRTLGLTDVTECMVWHHRARHVMGLVELRAKPPGCAVCRHEQVALVDASIRHGVGSDEIIAGLGLNRAEVSRKSISKHRRECLGIGVPLDRHQVVARKLTLPPQLVLIEPDHPRPPVRVVRFSRVLTREEEDARAAKRREKDRNRNRPRGVAFRDGLKREVIAAYGGECSCCGEAEECFLTIDHVNDDGAEHRERLHGGRKNGGGGWRTYLDLKHRGWPRDAYRLLCFNCNAGRRVNGGVCPHKESRTETGKGDQGVSSTRLALPYMYGSAEKCRNGNV